MQFGIGEIVCTPTGTPLEVDVVVEDVLHNRTYAEQRDSKRHKDQPARLLCVIHTPYTNPGEGSGYAHTEALDDVVFEACVENADCASQRDDEHRETTQKGEC